MSNVNRRGLVSQSPQPPPPCTVGQRSRSMHGRTQTAGEQGLGWDWYLRLPPTPTPTPQHWKTWWEDTRVLGWAGVGVGVWVWVVWSQMLLKKSFHLWNWHALFDLEKSEVNCIFVVFETLGCAVLGFSTNKQTLNYWLNWMCSFKKCLSNDTSKHLRNTKQKSAAFMCVWVCVSLPECYVTCTAVVLKISHLYLTVKKKGRKKSVFVKCIFKWCLYS